MTKARIDLLPAISEMLAPLLRALCSQEQVAEFFPDCFCLKMALPPMPLLIGDPSKPSSKHVGLGLGRSGEFILALQLPLLSPLQKVQVKT